MKKILTVLSNPQLIISLVILLVVGFAAYQFQGRSKFVPTKANVLTIEITSRTSPSTYVDATADIKAALITLQNSGGGILFFGPGKYLVKETITIPSNITIEGVGAGEVGPTMIVLASDGDLNATGMALLSIAPGATNVAIKDIELRSMTPGPNIYPRNDLDRIQSEQTSAIRMYGTQSTHTSNIQFENIRIVNFTYGIDVGSTDNSDPVIDNVKIKSLASSVNYLALRVKSLNAKNWDVQNLNVVEMAAGQNGVSLERSGKMAFLQLSCASTLHNALLCLDIGQRSDALYFTQAHVEGPSQGLRVRATSTSPIYFENSAIGGTIEEKNTIYSMGNRLSSNSAIGLFSFINNGTSSTLHTCGDVFTNGYPNPTETRPADPYPGLATVPAECDFDVSTITNSFSATPLPFEVSNWITGGSSPSAPVLNVKSFGAVGNGVADDTNAFRNAIAQTDPNYFTASTIVIPAGRYKITDTIALKDGITFQGDGNAIIEFDSKNKALFQVRALQTDVINKRGIGIKDLTLTSVNSNPSSQNTSAIELSGTRGAAGDFIFSGLNISNFTHGIYVHNDSGAFDDQQPEFDSIAVRNLTLTGNTIAIELHDQNASNWNFANIQILGIQSGQKGVVIDGGGGSFNGINCVGQSGADSCLSASRISGLRVDHLTSSNMKYAFYGVWPIGWTPFPVVIKNSDLRDGFYVAGKMYLLSVSNTYADGGQGNPLGSKTAFFNVYGSDDPLNVYPGSGSVISTCGDVFKNSSGAVSNGLIFTGLTTQPKICASALPSDTTPPVLSAGSPSGAQSAGTTSVNLTLTTNENATCKYGTTAGVAYGSIANTFTTTGSTSHSKALTGLTNGTSYTYYVRCQDSSGNANISDYPISFSVSAPAGDTTPPTVSVTAPSGGATVSGSSTTVSATASDNVGVVGVQFKLDGSNLGTEDTSSPYSITWDTTQASNASHTITAVARDAVGNSTSSSGVTVTVNNVTPPSTVATPTISPNGGSFTSAQSVTISTSTSGASIRYTTDGSTPSSTTGTVYSSSFQVSSTSTIKAIAYKSGLVDSSVSSATYTIGTVPPINPPPVNPPPVNPPPVTPPPTSSGPKLVNNLGTYYFIENGFKKGITSPGILYSCGFEFKDSSVAQSSDLTLPSSLLLPCAGALVKSVQDPTVYFVSSNHRYGFTSSKVFTDLGFKFSSVLTVTDPELQALPKANNLNSGTAAHLPSTDINLNGTIYWIDESLAKHAYPSLEIYNSWHRDGDFTIVVPANSADLSLTTGSLVTARVVQ